MSDKLSDDERARERFRAAMSPLPCEWSERDGKFMDAGVQLAWFAWNKALAASPAPAIPAVHWQPIETAPKDGSMILMWVHANRHLIDEDGNPYEENFATVDFGEWKEFGEHGGAFIAYSGPHGDGADGITHWMPLPVDPTDDALKAAPAISESEDAVAWQVRRADVMSIQWEHCTKELYDATLATGRYAGYGNGPRCEVRELFAARKGEKS
ncbi:hypothetical protein [Burkholderia glumae]|uniref:hypothetical protein n=1 Tax=Burkholderia glumae TaxID=337 RepID=UPI002150AE8D|nr:hypothetical protein [Burkholderia glumae]